jgi:ACT domain-containing protein
MKKAIITVVGKDRVGIISSVADILAKRDVNILDISQTILDDMFTMMMLVDVEKSTEDFTTLSASLKDCGKNIGVEIRIQLEEIFQSMHRI